MTSHKNNHNVTKLNVSEAAINVYIEGALRSNDLVKKSVTEY